MDVTHSWQRKHEKVEASGLFMLSNKSGAFFSSADCNITKYNGLVWHDKGFYKTIERFSIIGTPLSMKNSINALERTYKDGAVERFEFKGAALHYTLKNYHGPLFLDLDARKVDDYDADGRAYHVSHEEKQLRIHYNKRGAYDIDITIDGVPNFEPLDDWEPRTYEYDARRNDAADFWIYRAGRINVDGNLKLAVALPAGSQQLDGDGSLPETLAFASLDSLTVDLGKGKTILAGYPWFTQSWTRDELISVGAYIRAGKFSLVKEILDRYYAHLETYDSFDAHFPTGGLRSADASGWLAKRTLDFLHALEETKVTDNYYSSKELAHIGNLMKKALGKSPMKDGLIVNGPGETWMDAPTDGDTREGASIEIQALHLCGLALCSHLQLPGARHREKEFSRLVKQQFFSDGKVADNIHEKTDFTPRPNVFLVFYLYPHLLKLQEWRDVFDSLLEELWLDWGGLSSISTKSPLFLDTYQGMKNTSYHRGDSWYWLNCLAALCLHHFDPKHYKKYIAALKDAAVDDLLSQGAIGHCSEVSSAGKQEWGGCFAQAWSAAMLYELLVDME